MEPDPATAAPLDRTDPQSVGSRVGALFEAHGRMVYAVCRMLLREREEAEDATQQTFLLAHRSLLGGVVPERPEAWLATIARNECYRRLGRRPPTPLPLLDSDGGSDDPSRLADQRAEIEALCEALAELPPAQRHAVVLREFYGLSYREVAAALGVSGPAVESLLFKSRRRLQDRLRPIRAASSVLILPLALRDSLAAAIPGFSAAASGAASGGASAAGGALLAKIGSAPLAAKIAAAVVAGTGTTVTVAELRHDAKPSPARSGLETRWAGRQLGPAAAAPGPVGRGAPSPLEDADDEEGDERREGDGEERKDDGERDHDRARDLDDEAERDERDDGERGKDDEQDERAERDEDEREERVGRRAEQTRPAGASEPDREDDDEDEHEQSGRERSADRESAESVEETGDDTNDDLMLSTSTAG